MKDKLLLCNGKLYNSVEDIIAMLEAKGTFSNITHEREGVIKVLGKVLPEHLSAEDEAFVVYEALDTPVSKGKLEVLYALYNDEVREYLGYTANPNLLELLRTAQELLLPQRMSVDFEDNYVDVGVDYHDVGAEGLEDFVMLDSFENIVNQPYVYEMTYSLWTGVGEVYSGGYNKVYLHSSDQTAVEKAYTNSIKQSHQYYITKEKQHDGLVEIVLEVKRHKLKNLDKMFEGEGI